MVKLGIKIKANEEDINVSLVDPTKKELDTATEDEKMIAQAFKELFNEKLLSLLQDKINNN